MDHRLARHQEATQPRCRQFKCMTVYEIDLDRNCRWDRIFGPCPPLKIRYLFSVSDCVGRRASSSVRHHPQRATNCLRSAAHRRPSPTNRFAPIHRYPLGCSAHLPLQVAVDDGLWTAGAVGGKREAVGGSRRRRRMAGCGWFEQAAQLQEERKRRKRLSFQCFLRAHCRVLISAVAPRQPPQRQPTRPRQTLSPFPLTSCARRPGSGSCGHRT